MYAIIQSGGKQYRVEKGDVIAVELLEAHDNQVTFQEVLFLHDGKKGHVGAPYVAGWAIKGVVQGVELGPKTHHFTFKRRKNFRRKVGHRQKYMEVEITELAPQVG